jgi:Fe-S oxidoreductase
MLIGTTYAQEYTRQIYWSPAGTLPEFLHKSTYLWLLIATGIFIHGFYKQYQVWQQGKPENVWQNIPKRLWTLCQYASIKAKFARKRHGKNKEFSWYASIMHSCVYNGFLFLFFTTSIVALKDYHVVDWYHGNFYIFLKIGSQLGGLAVLFGVGLGIYRRFFQYKALGNVEGHGIAYGFLGLLVLQGFFLQSIRLYAIHPWDTPYAFVSLVISHGFPSGLSADAITLLYQYSWYFHMVTTMLFLGSLPYTFLGHIVKIPLNIYTYRPEPSVRLAPVDLTDESAEYFGVQKITDFTWKDLLGFDSCVNCRRCTDICPAQAAGKPLDPRALILKLRDTMRIDAKKDTKTLFFEDGIVSNQEIFSCTNCGACVNECPAHINQLRPILQLKQYQTLTLGEIPATAAKTIDNIKQYGNPWGLPRKDRFKWIESLPAPKIEDQLESVDYLYFVGCAGAYDATNQPVVKSMVHLLNKAGVSYAVMSKNENCTGEPVKRLGDEYSFSEIAIQNVNILSKLAFKKVVTHCPHCFNTLKNDYSEYGGHYEVLHHSQLLSDLMLSGKLQVQNQEAVLGSVTYHDPCFLGRHNGEYSGSRQIIQKITTKFKEIQTNQEHSTCCGMGGGQAWYEIEEGEKLAVKRLDQIGDTKASTLVTGCSFCLINFKSSSESVEKTAMLKVKDIAQFMEENSI